MVVLTGHVGSSFIYTAPILCNQFNIKIQLIVFSDDINKKKDTKRILEKIGANAIFIDYNSDDIISKAIAKKKEKELINNILKIKKSDYTYIIPEGGARYECISAYIEAFKELNIQLQEKNIRDYEVHLPVGSGSTFLGLYLGAKLYNDRAKIIGVSVSYNKERILKNFEKILNNDSFKMFNKVIDLKEIKIIDKWAGSGYGKSTVASQEAIKTVLNSESILLDETYTAKGICEILFNNITKTDKKNIVFWHTGGLLQSIKSLIEN